MKHTIAFPDYNLNGELRLLVIDDRFPTFSGTHSMKGLLGEIVSDSRVPLEPSGFSDPVDWTGPSGVLLALVTAETQFGEDGSLYELLPDALKNAPARSIEGRDVDNRHRFELY